jgi:peptidoglycan/xylan/chitin deacetylase (PgdA/CDA1 family)
MGFARTGRIAVVACVVVATIGAAVVVTSAIQDRARPNHPSAVAIAASSTVQSLGLLPRTPLTAPAFPTDIQVTVPTLTEADPTEPLVTLSPNTVVRTRSGLTATTPPTRPTRAHAVAPKTPLPSPVPPPPAPSHTAAVPAQYAHPLGWVSSGKVVSLTFDDGPSQYTGRVLDVLQRYGIKATFCQIGDQVGEYPAIEARIKAAGHTFCDHTWDHDEALPDKSVAVIDSEISRTQQAIRALTQVTPSYYRAPGGDWGRTTKLRLELARFHTVPLAWADDSLDWTKPGAAVIVHTVLSTVSAGAIILMHDGGGNRTQTIAALPRIIVGLRAAGYHFVVLPPNPNRWLRSEQQRKK